MRQKRASWKPAKEQFFPLVRSPISKKQAIIGEIKVAVNKLPLPNTDSTVKSGKQSPNQAYFGFDKIEVKGGCGGCMRGMCWSEDEDYKIHLLSCFNNLQS
jgi:hypothetical protein